MRQSKVLSRAFPVLLALSLALSGVGGLVAAADDSASGGDGVYTGVLPGNPNSGSFALYDVTYLGEGTLTVTLRPVYRDAGQAKAFGVVLYAPDGRQEFGEPQSDGTYFALDYVASSAEVVAIQVFNYSNEQVAYSLEIEGAAAVSPADEKGAVTETATEEAATETATPEAVATEEATPTATEALTDAVATEAATATPAAEETVTPTAEEAAALADVETVETASMLLNVSDMLVGDRGGAFAEYDVTATSAAPLLIAMQPSVLDPSFGAASGFVVYDIRGTVIAHGLANDDGIYEVTLVPTAGETYIVQVFNYAPGQPLTYSLQVTR